MDQELVNKIYDNICLLKKVVGGGKIINELEKDFLMLCELATQEDINKELENES